jgi:ATP-dependent DNA helicase RecQ
MNPNSPQGSPTPTLAESLRKRFGFRRFRPGQRQAVESALAGRDTLVIMPTGSGKSLCFQLPALELPGMTVVVSPLIALMKDQVDALRERGVRAAALHSGLGAAEEREALADLDAGRLEFCYATPERLGSAEFRERLRRQGPIDLIVIDEAHCVSHWGHDFRPEYLELGTAIDALGRPPVLALTATATEPVVRDVLDTLRIPDAQVVHTGFYRENLFLEVIPVSDEAQRLGRLAALLERLEGQGIVYTATVKAVSELSAALEARGVSAAGYHGRLAARRRAEVQDRFMRGEVRVMVATNAFGLGIDKPDIRYVIHHHMPANLDSYYQEFGRAGRDGLPSRACLLYYPEDRKLFRFFQAGRYPAADDLVNAHHALRRLAEGSEASDFDAIHRIAPLPRSKLRAVLNLLAARGVVAREDSGAYRLLQPDLAREDLARLTASERERDEHDRVRLQQVTEYAEARRCRWDYLLDAFGRDDEPDLVCGHCDRCVPERATLAAAEAVTLSD